MSLNFWWTLAIVASIIIAQAAILGLLFYVNKEKEKHK